MKYYWTKSPAWAPLVYPSLQWSVNDSEKTIYLTFDDGPTPKITEWVLDQLNSFGVKGTFFCIGKNVVQHPEIFARIQNEGHAVGNHTMNHLNGWMTKESLYLENVAQAAEIIPSKLFRPPYGKMSPGQIRHLKHKYKIVMWSILTGDYKQNLDKKTAWDQIQKQLKPGSIVVFHDSIKATENLKYLLPKMLELMKTHGWESKKIQF